MPMCLECSMRIPVQQRSCMSACNVTCFSMDPTLMWDTGLTMQRNVNDLQDVYQNHQKDNTLLIHQGNYLLFLFCYYYVFMLTTECCGEESYDLQDLCSIF